MVIQASGNVCVARNTGYAMSSPGSKYLLFLDHDDVLEPSFLDRLSGYLDENPVVGVAYTSLKLIDGAGNTYPEVDWVHPQRYIPSWNGYRLQSSALPETSLMTLMAYFQCVPTSCLFRRYIYEKAGGWNEETGRLVYEDKDLVMRCALIAPVHLIDEYLAQYRWHDTNASHKENPDYRRHYERRWMQGDFLTVRQRALARRGIEFDRRVAGLFALSSAGKELAQGQMRTAARSMARGAFRLATAPLARIGW
jgi:glycosyltransferase involved in cell wall biosynthesis